MAVPRKASQTGQSDVDPIRLAGAAVIALKLALIPVVFDPLGEEAFSVPKSVVSRAGMYLLLLLAVVYLAANAAARARLLAPRDITAALTAFGSVAAVSTIFAVDRATALFGAHHRYLGLTSILDGIVLALSVPLFVTGAIERRIVFGGLFAGTFGVLVYAVAQALGVDPLRWQDPTSSLGNRGVYAGYLVITGSAAAALALSRRWHSAQRWAPVALAVISAASAVLVVRSGARGPILALPFVALLVIAVAVHQGWRPAFVRGPLRAGAFATLGLLSLVAAATVALPRLATLVAGGDTSLVERAVVYESAFWMIASRPLIGAGPDHFAVLYPHARPLSAATDAIQAGQTSAHSWPLHQAIGTGAVGILVLAALVVSSTRRSWMIGPTAGTSALAVGTAVVGAFLAQGMFNISSVGTEFLFWAGVGLTAVRAGPVAGPVQRGRSLGRQVVLLAVALAAGAVLASTTLNWHESNRAVRASDVHRTAGRLELAERAALVATQLDPGRANNWNVLGLARSPGSARRALPAFERAWQAAPYESRYLINVIKEEARIGESDRVFLERALSHALRAVEIDPRNAETHRVLSYVLLKTDDPVGARREADLGIALAPQDRESYAWSAAIHEESGDLLTAVKRFETYYAMSTAAGADDAGARRRLARLYVRAGMRDMARPIARPRAVAAAKICDPECRGVIIRFDTMFGLGAEGVGGARDPRNYSIDDRPLQSDAVVTLAEQDTVVVVSWPQGSTPLRAGAVVAISGVVDSEGFPIDPDPTRMTLP